MRSKSSEPSTPERAWQYALRLLAARDYTVSRMTGKLCLKGFTPEDAEAAVSRLVAEGWLNDRRFAERFAETALSSNRFFGKRLSMEMRRRGVPADVVSDVLSASMPEHDEGEAVRLLLDKRFPGFSYAASDDRQKRRVFGFLQRRGFSAVSIQRAIRD